MRRSLPTLTVAVLLAAGSAAVWFKWMTGASANACGFTHPGTGLSALLLGVGLVGGSAGIALLLGRLQTTFRQTAYPGTVTALLVLIAIVTAAFIFGLTRHCFA